MISGVNKMKSIIFRPCSDLFNPNQLLNLSIINQTNKNDNGINSGNIIRLAF